MLDDGGGRWGGLSPLRPLRSHGGGLRDDMLVFFFLLSLLLLLLLLCVQCATSTAFAADLRNSAARDVPCRGRPPSRRWTPAARAASLLGSPAARQPYQLAASASASVRPASPPHLPVGTRLHGRVRWERLPW